MSEQTTEPEAIELPPSGDAAFAALMDALAPEPDEAPTQEGAAPAAAPAEPAAGADAEGAGAGGQEPAQPEQSAATAGGDGGDATGTEQPEGPGADGDSGQAADDGDGGQPATGDGAGRPASWTASSAELKESLGELATKLEERTQQTYQQEALEEVQSEHSAYFQALEQHPRLLVGREVPAIGKEGTETLATTEDAREWQEAVKHLLVAEVRSRASKRMDENAQLLSTLHASIEIFQNNSDLVPGTQEFDVELANRVAKLVEPYELRVEGKLQGYTIPVQPIIDQLRAQIAAERAAGSKEPAAQEAAGGALSTTAPAASSAPASESSPEPPQAGIQSKAGADAESAEDFSTLFGTIGLPNLRI